MDKGIFIKLDAQAPSSQEVIAALATLTPAVKSLLSTMLADTVRARLALSFDPLNPLLFAQAEAEQKAKYLLLSFLLQDHTPSQGE